MDLSFLGEPIGPAVRVHGGYANRMYRLDTDQGSFAVKELNVDDRRWVYRVDDVFRFEKAAFAAGVPMPEPVAADEGTLVHRWVEGEKVPEAPVAAAYGFEVGEILARIHGLDVEWPDEPVEEPTPGDWDELAAQAVATGQPWAAELASRVETFQAIARFVETCPRPGPVVLTHKDIQPWNLLARDGRPVVIDWELSGKLDLSGELGSTALSLCKGPGFDDIQPEIFRAVLDGYVAGGGELPEPGPSWFVYLIGGWLGHTRWNVLRCLAGVEANTGPELALSQESAGNGIRGLPELFERRPELERLVV
ncbi:phosphotransferase [Kribbella sp. NPDC051770]|uniref:phosphotransferase family protein n=1 Tax=Kribbella sp. NPDC051770 TaxID=3155413 RepID=UPI00342E643A